MTGGTPPELGFLLLYQARCLRLQLAIEKGVFHHHSTSFNFFRLLFLPVMARLAVVIGVINLELSEFEVVIKNKKERKPLAAVSPTPASQEQTE